MTFIGIDNGITGSIGIIKVSEGWDIEIYYYHIPTEKTLYYTKKKVWITKIRIDKLIKMLKPHISQNTFTLIERPMVNPARWKASVSALLAYDRTEYAIQLLGLSFQYIDSKEWQKNILPQNVNAKELKKASLEIGKRLFPCINFDKFQDADGLLIAEYCRRRYIKG